MTLIVEILAGNALELVLKGGKAAADKLLAQDPPQRMLWIIYEQYGEETGLSRREFLAWLLVEDLGDAIFGVVWGNLVTEEANLVRELIVPQLMNTPTEQRDQLASEIAKSMFLLAPWLHRDLEEGIAHLSHKMDQHSRLLLDVVGGRKGENEKDVVASAAEAMLRGPLVQIGQETQAKEARQLAEDGESAAAAKMFEGIAEALKDAALGIVAETYLRLAGELYGEAGDGEAAARVLKEVAEGQVLRGGASSVRLTVGELRKFLAPEWGWEANAFEARVDFGHDMTEAIDALRVACEKSEGREDADEHLANYTDLLAFAGESKAVHQATEAVASCEPADEVSLRIQLNRLDALNALGSSELESQWAELLRNLDRGQEPVWAGIAWQRRGASLARDGEVDRCHDAYRRAMGAFSAVPGYQEQAADSFYSLQTASIMNSVPPPETELRALAYEQRGSLDAPVARARMLARQGMDHRIAGRLPDALQEYTLALEMNRRAGSLQGELEVREKLGELFLEAGRPAIAMSSYIAAGNAKEAAAAARLAPAEGIAGVLRTNVSRWERAAVLAVLSEAGERLPLEYLVDLGPWVLKEAEGEPDGWMAPQPSLQARLALPAILLGLPDDQREAGVAQVTADLEQGAIDVKQAAARCLQHATSVGLTDATEPLVKAFLADPYNCRISVEFLAERVKEEVRAREAIEAAATGGGPALSVMSLAGMVEGNHELERAAESAAKSLSEAVNVKFVEGGISVGLGSNFEDEAIAAHGASEAGRAAAVNRLLEIANDSKDSELNRFHAANGLFNLAVAIPEGQAADAVACLAPLAVGDYRLSRWDHNIDDPLSRMRISTHTQAALWSAALGAIGRILHENPELSRKPLVDAVITTYQRGPDIAVTAATEALAQVTEIEVPVPIEVLLADSDAAVRVAALRCWEARNDGLPPQPLLAALRADSSTGVRHNLVLMAAEVGDWSLVEQIAAADEHSLIRRVAEKRFADRPVNAAQMGT